MESLGLVVASGIPEVDAASAVVQIGRQDGDSDKAVGLQGVAAAAAWQDICCRGMAFRWGCLLAQLVVWGLRGSCAECEMEGGDSDCEMAKLLGRLTNGGCQGYSGDGRVVERQSWVGSGVKQVG